MNLKARIKSLERKIDVDEEGMAESELLFSNIVHKGKPFNSINEIRKAYNVTHDFAPFYLYDNYISLFNRGFLSYDSEEMKQVREAAEKKMREAM